MLTNGWEPPLPEQAEKALTTAALTVVARDPNGKAVGMIRVICDYCYVSYITDVMVLPEFHGQGIGAELMQWALTWIDDNTPEGTYMAAHLMACDSDVEKFYEKFGFNVRPYAGRGAGMTRDFDKRIEIG